MQRARQIGPGLSAVLALLASPASADPASGTASLQVAVGATASLDVGFARGLHCDDVKIIRPELRAESPTSNRLYVTGLHPGSTLCRAGLVRPGPTVLVSITVEPARR